MLSNLVNLSMQYYADPSRNRPLDGGKIFVGEVDKDPENFPIDVFYIEENGDEVLAAQPIIIGAGGIVMYNGKPVQIGTESAYSIRVRDSDDAQVYYIPDSAAADSSSQFTDMDPVFEMTLAEAVASTQIIEGLLLVISDRDLGYFQVVATSSVVPNGLDIIECVGNPALSLELRLTGIVSALAAGALLDWNGTTGTDDTLALQNLHTKLVSYTLRGRYALISAPLVMRTDQTVDARGGGIHTTSTDVMFTTNNIQRINFTLEHGSFTAENSADFAQITGSNSSFLSRNILFNQCVATGFGTCLTFRNATECIISGGSYSCKIGVSLQVFTSFISFLNSNFSRDTDEIDGTAGLISIQANKILFDNVQFSKFEVSINIGNSGDFSFRRSRFVGDSSDSGSIISLDSIIRSSFNVHIENCIFIFSGLSYLTGFTNFRFRAKLNNCSFTETPESGIDVEIGTLCSNIEMLNNYHSIGGGLVPENDKTAYLARGSNNLIVINSPVFDKYGLYVKLISSGTNNTISNIINTDELDIPIIIDYPVNVYNVEGFTRQYFNIIPNGAYDPQVLTVIDNVVLSAGHAVLKIEADIESFNPVIIEILEAGSLTPSSVVSTLYPINDVFSSIGVDRYNIPLTVEKATAIRVAIKFSGASASIITGDGLVMVYQ